MLVGEQYSDTVSSFKRR